MDFNLADLFEHAVDQFGEREYLVANGERRTYAEMEERANRLAHHLAGAGVKAGDHVGIYALNRVEWVETLWAVFKLRAVWVNINYRYVADELRYLFDNADLVALVVDRSFAGPVAELWPDLPDLREVLVVEDGSGADLAPLEQAASAAGPASPAGPAGAGAGVKTVVGYEEALAGGAPVRDFGPRSGDDLYILYTGGTTGMPKGVVWRHRDVLFALGGGIDVLTGERIERPTQLAEKSIAQGGQRTYFPIAPLMHGATQWAVMGQSFQGHRIVLVDRFEAARAWQLVAEEKVNVMMITGDAMGRPLVEELDRNRDAYDLSMFFALSSTAAIFSPAVKDGFFRHLPNLIMTDAIGSSESGANGVTLVSKDQTAMSGGPTVTRVATSTVLGDDLKPLSPGTGEIGRLARSGDIPIGYYRDPEKTAETFVEVDGVRHVIVGDFARVEEDGRITLLGRGSVSINSGGEKIFPEEVEVAVKSHPDVYDVTVVGVPDERWGQRVVAVVEPRPGCTPTLESVMEHSRQFIAGYKVPRQLHLVEHLVRSPSGKPDYRWAMRAALGEAADQPDAGRA
jgi:acyl-CoA synthetase (AMP-forming)/AMP-acid ligase II